VFHTVGGGKGQLISLADELKDEFQQLQADSEAQKVLIEEYTEERSVRRTGTRIGQKSQAAIFVNTSNNIRILVRPIII